MSSTATKPKASQHHLPLLALSSEYLAGCTLVGDVSAPRAAEAAAAEPREAPQVAAADGEDGNFHCGVSRATFESAEALREHYHTDWYRFNLKRAQRQLAPVRHHRLKRSSLHRRLPAGWRRGVGAGTHALQQPTTQLMHAHHLQVDETEFERLVEADAFEEELSGSDSDGEDEEGEEGGGAPVEGRARLMLRDATGAHLLLWRAVLGGQ
eukprot:scaffold52042_cov48-Phaeocystis_antarctica.AAC.2